MLGLSTSKYGQAVREFSEAYGLEKSEVSEHFIEASRAKLKDLMERRLDKIPLCALLTEALFGPSTPISRRARGHFEANVPQATLLPLVDLDAMHMTALLVRAIDGGLDSSFVLRERRVNRLSHL